MKLGVLGLFFLFLLLVKFLGDVQADEQPTALEPLLSAQTRLLVISPHPDDGVLGAGGLMQRVLREGGAVKVVFMTSGDGYPEGVEVAKHITQPLPQDYREYGALRRAESFHALGRLGLSQRDIAFLGFPDRGLCPILLGYWGDAPPYYRSPYTQQDRPLSYAAVLSDVQYDGEDLRRELVHLIAEFRPTLLVTSHPRDQHPDHCATFFFVQEAFRAYIAQHPTLHPTFLRFLIHFGRWPQEMKTNMENEQRLTPPPHFPEEHASWLSLPLTAAEIEGKRRALTQYESQMMVMGAYLLSFVRANELFSPASHADAEASEKPQCCGQVVIQTPPAEHSSANGSGVRKSLPLSH